MHRRRRDGAAPISAVERTLGRVCFFLFTRVLLWRCRRYLRSVEDDAVH